MTDTTTHLEANVGRYTPLPRPVPIRNQVWPGGTVPVVSICCITYNHGPFIRQCLDGFLMQETTFPVEILIHDDASTDDTASIIRDYSERHPHLFKPILQSQNQYSKGISPNRHFNFPRARGDFIALCEGDDYWTDAAKLQRQCEFLAKNLEYVLVAENAHWLNDTSGQMRPFSKEGERDIHLEDLLNQRQFATASVLFRNLGAQLDTGEISGDTILWCHLTKFGRLRYIPIISSVYRRHQGGVTGTNKLEWAMKMAAWNAALKSNHPQIASDVFFRRNIENFRSAVAAEYRKGKYKRMLEVIEELAAVTEDPSAYRSALHDFVDAQLRKKDSEFSELDRIRQSLTFRVANVFAWPLRRIRGIRQRVAGVASTIRDPKLGNERERLIRERGYRWIDKEEVRRRSQALQRLVPPNPPRTPRLIVSLTTYPARIEDAFYALVSLMEQDTVPDMLVLWLAREQFPGLEADLPPQIRSLQKLGLQIRWCEDLKSYKKLVPALREFPDAVIVTADDDIFYPRDWLRRLHDAYVREPTVIHVHRAHRVAADESGRPAPYARWTRRAGPGPASFATFGTTGGGALYPPGSLHPSVTDADTFRRVAPTADDLWFWVMALLQGTRVRVVDAPMTELLHVDVDIALGTHAGGSLWNVNRNANDEQLARIAQHVADKHGFSIAERLRADASGAAQAAAEPIEARPDTGLTDAAARRT